jgi:hypothetical protein
MLLTNITVAQRIAVHLPEQALLRRHDTPLERRLVSHYRICNPTPVTILYRIFSPNVPIDSISQSMSPLVVP